jgi:hypothetical protein
LDDAGTLAALRSDAPGQVQALAAAAGFNRDGRGKSWDVTGIVLYLGNDVLSFRDRIFGLPLSVFWAFR